MADMLTNHGSENYEAVRSVVGCIISSISIDGNQVIISFSNGKMLSITDNGQSCCEHRYITSDDLPVTFSEVETLVSVDSREMPTMSDEFGDPHEQCAVIVQTTLQSLTFVTHNEHNGYYGGFSLVAKVL